MMSLLDLSIKEIHQRLREKELTVSQLVEAALARMDEVEPQLNAFITMDREGARKRAAALDQEEPQEKGLLFGLPMSIKDNISTKGIKTTCASKMLAEFIPSYDATVVEKLKAAGSVLVGKTNLDEFAMGSSTEYSSFGAVHNPWNLDYVAGGSSGGSAASVASRAVYFSLASDTGGAVRQPAAFCGVVGLKPTYGLVSRYGLVANASSMDQVGILTKQVEDAAHVLQAIAGHDPYDSTSAKVEVPDYAAQLTGEVKGLRLAVPRAFLDEKVDAEVRAKVLEALEVLAGLGATWEEVDLAYGDYLLSTYYILASAEASSSTARYDGVGYGTRAEVSNLKDLYTHSRSQGFGAEVKRRIVMGTYFLSEGQYADYYLKAQKVRTLIRQEVEALFEKYDLVIGPTTPTTAFKLGEKLEDPLVMYEADRHTVLANLTGIPALSLPCGFSEKGLPIGLQMMAKAFDEATLLKVAHAYEQSTSHHQARPGLLSKGEA